MRAQVPRPKVWACRAAPQNLLDLAFKPDKIKPKQKDFGYCVAEKQFRVRPALSIAETLEYNMKNILARNKALIIQKVKRFDLLTVVNTVAPKYITVQQEISELNKRYPNKSKKELANIYGNRLKRKYTSVGVVSALPGAIPGIGTAGQVAIETGAISGDLALMLRWMAATCYGIAIINGKDIQAEFNQEFVKVLGLWCGVIETTKVATEKIATKVVVAQFNKNVSGKALSAINKRVGVTLFTKYGTKRGGIALGRLIPFGVGATIGGLFNYFTMSRFKSQALAYFEATEDIEYIIYQNINE
jgi:hypothetical protein